MNKSITLITMKKITGIFLMLTMIIIAACTKDDKVLPVITLKGNQPRMWWIGAVRLNILSQGRWLPTMLMANSIIRWTAP